MRRDMASLRGVRHRLACNGLLFATAILCAVPVQAQQAPAAQPSAAGAVAVDDSFTRLMRELLALVRAKCPPPAGRGHEVAVIGIKPDDLRFTDAQRMIIAQRLSGAVSALTVGDSATKIGNFHDLTGLVAAMGAGGTRERMTDLYLKADQSRTLAIFAHGSRVGNGFQLSLSAGGLNGATCAEQTQPQPVAADEIPDDVLQPEQLMVQPGEFLLLNSRGKGEQTLYVRSRFIDDRPAPDALSNRFVLSMNQGIQIARDRVPTQLGETPTNVRVERATNLKPADAWNADVVIERRSPEKTYVDVLLNPPAGQTTIQQAFKGLVHGDALPAISEADLKAADPLLPAKGTSTGSVHGIEVSAQPQRIAMAIGGAVTSKELVFTVVEDMVLEVDLWRFAGAIAPRIALINQTGTLVPNQFPGAAAPALSRPHMQRWRLAPGRYSIWVQHKDPAPLQFDLRVRGASGSLAPDPIGTLTGNSGDWWYGFFEENGARTCYAISPAIEHQPRNWRLLRPSMLVQINKQDRAVQTRIDRAGEWAKPERVYGEVTRADRRLPLSLGINGTTSIELSEPCADGQGACVTGKTLRALADGSQLTLYGATSERTVRDRDNRERTVPSEQGIVTYSLRGYQTAVAAMANLCDQTAFGRDLLMRVTSR